MHIILKYCGMWLWPCLDLLIMWGNTEILELSVRTQPQVMRKWMFGLDHCKEMISYIALTKWEIDRWRERERERDLHFFRMKAYAHTALHYRNDPRTGENGGGVQWEHGLPFNPRGIFIMQVAFQILETGFGYKGHLLPLHKVPYWRIRIWEKQNNSEKHIFCSQFTFFFICKGNNSRQFMHTSSS